LGNIWPGGKRDMVMVMTREGNVDSGFCEGAIA
jgi:hypothetical protein